MYIDRYINIPTSYSIIGWFIHQTKYWGCVLMHRIKTSIHLRLVVLYVLTFLVLRVELPAGIWIWLADGVHRVKWRSQGFSDCNLLHRADHELSSHTMVIMRSPSKIRNRQTFQRFFLNQVVQKTSSHWTEKNRTPATFHYIMCGLYSISR